MPITYNNLYNQYPILTNQDLGYGCDVDILARLEALFNYMTQRHSKVLFIRFDVRFPLGIAYTNDNYLFINFIACFIKHYQRKDLDPAYIWVREQDSSINLRGIVNNVSHNTIFLLFNLL